MSKQLAIQEIRRFLCNPDPEVLSISGRWGVGKTYTWKSVFEEMRDAKQISLKNYAYVSAFGTRTIEDLKAQIVQSTVRIDSPSIEPTIQSFNRNIRDRAGLRHVFESAGRKGLGIINSAAGIIPGGERLASEILLPSANLMIRNQLICIDDLERAGHELSLSDILGTVSWLRDERRCKIVLLLNYDKLDEQQSTFDLYLEKVIDQAIRFTPTAQESIDATIRTPNPFEGMLLDRVGALGITNIRVINRLRRFLSHIEPILVDKHESIARQAVSTIVLIGWSLFEKDLAPSITHIIDYNSYTSLLKKEPTEEEAKWNTVLRSYNFAHLDEFDNLLVEGLKAGGFDVENLEREAKKLDSEARNNDHKASAMRPWIIFRDSFDDNEQEFVKSLIETTNIFAKYIDPGQLSHRVDALCELGMDEIAKILVENYFAIHGKEPASFYDQDHYNHFSSLNPLVANKMREIVSNLHEQLDPKTTLIALSKKDGWSQREVDFLASLEDEFYYNIMKKTRGKELSAIISASLQFGRYQGIGESEMAITRKARMALKRISGENRFNAMRIKPYLPKE